MKFRLPDWATFPPVVLGFAGICFAIPILVGISDRAAAFAGGLTSGLAAVIAVVVGGNINRENDRTRDRRQRHRELSALGIEIDIAIELAKTSFSQLNGPLKRYYLGIERSAINIPGLPRPPSTEQVRADIVGPYLLPYTEPFSERIVSKIGQFPREIAVVITNYIAVVRFIREVAIEIPKRQPQAFTLPSGFVSYDDAKALSGHLETAIRIAQLFNREVSAYLATLEVE